MPQPQLLPPIINPTGIIRERADYLYKEIREFCRPGTEDLVAPRVTFLISQLKLRLGIATFEYRVLQVVRSDQN